MRNLTRYGVLVASCLLLAACTTPAGTVPPTPIERADEAVTRAQAAYDRIRMFADILRPLLPAPYQDRLIIAQLAEECGLAMAQAAVTLAEQLAALRQAEAAVADIARITGAN